MQSCGSMGSDGGDRWRTGAARINMGGFTIGANIFTGDPGGTYDNRPKEDIYGDGQLYYTGEHANDYRAGIVYAGFGPIQVGWNSEEIRDSIQNDTLHSWSGDPYFSYVEGKADRLYWHIGTGSGNTLW